MIITLKNKDTLQVDDFNFKCTIGKNGTSSSKFEGDKKTPKGIFSIDKLYYRKDLIKKPITKLKCIPIKKNMGWCHDLKRPSKYNRLIKVNKNDKHEKVCGTNGLGLSVELKKSNPTVLSDVGSSAKIWTVKPLVPL